MGRLGGGATVGKGDDSKGVGKVERKMSSSSPELGHGKSQNQKDGSSLDHEDSRLI